MSNLLLPAYSYDFFIYKLHPLNYCRENPVKHAQSSEAVCLIIQIITSKHNPT